MLAKLGGICCDSQEGKEYHSDKKQICYTMKKEHIWLFKLQENSLGWSFTKHHVPECNTAAPSTDLKDTKSLALCSYTAHRSRLSRNTIPSSSQCLGSVASLQCQCQVVAGVAVCVPKAWHYARKEKTTHCRVMRRILERKMYSHKYEKTKGGFHVCWSCCHMAGSDEPIH